MNWKQYQNELIVVIAALFMVGTLLYKQGKLSSQAEETAQARASAEEIREVVSLQKVWGDKKIASKVIKLKDIVPASKVKWSKKKNKVTANYEGLSPSELNKLTTKVLNLGVEIEQFDVQKNGANYTVEFRCKW